MLGFHKEEHPNEGIPMIPHAGEHFDLLLLANIHSTFFCQIYCMFLVNSQSALWQSEPLDTQGSLNNPNWDNKVLCLQYFCFVYRIETKQEKYHKDRKQQSLQNSFEVGWKENILTEKKMVSHSTFGCVSQYLRSQSSVLADKVLEEQLEKKSVHFPKMQNQ